MISWGPYLITNNFLQRSSPQMQNHCNSYSRFNHCTHNYEARQTWELLKAITQQFLSVAIMCCLAVVTFVNVNSTSSLQLGSIHHHQPESHHHWSFEEVSQSANHWLGPGNDQTRVQWKWTTMLVSKKNQRKHKTLYKCSTHLIQQKKQNKASK